MWLALNILVLCSTTLLVKSINANRPLIKTDLGQLEGVWLTSAKGLKYAAFMGIPYAKPPVDDLRFEVQTRVRYPMLCEFNFCFKQPPEKIEPWTGVLDAGAYRSFCMAYERNLAVPDIIAGQEDCLYLNIFTPNNSQNANDDKLLDVIFYIHGGSFMSGRSDYYGAKYIMDRNVILVTINYRVGPLGKNILLRILQFFNTNVTVASCFRFLKF